MVGSFIINLHQVSQNSLETKLLILFIYKLMNEKGVEVIDWWMFVHYLNFLVSQKTLSNPPPPGMEKI